MPQTISSLLNGGVKGLPNWDRVRALVIACVKIGKRRGLPMPPQDVLLEQWRLRHAALARALDQAARRDSQPAPEDSAAASEQPRRSGVVPPGEECRYHAATVPRAAGSNRTAVLFGTIPRVWPRNPRRWKNAGIVVGLVGLLWLIGRWIYHGHLAPPLTLLAAAAAMLAISAWPRPRADDPAMLAAHARPLLERILTAENRALQQLLAGAGDSQPANIGFDQRDSLDPAEAVRHPELVRWRPDGGDDSGSLATILRYYRSLERGRLVVLGEPGSGKTVLVIKLLLDLADEARAGSASGAAERIVVPVRMSLSAFTATDRPPPAVRTELDEWIARHLTTVYGVERPIAHALVACGWILPILDGLDEMDPDDAEPARARTVIAALNLYPGPDRWPVVLTSRTQRYQHLASATADPTAARGVLQDTTVIMMEPLDVEQVIAWLAHRFPARDQPDRLAPRWHPIAGHLQEKKSGPLASWLSSPLHLYLAVTVYEDPATTPADLLDPKIDNLNDKLYELLIPSVAAHRPRRDGACYHPDDVRRWLRTLADHLAWMGANGHSGVDLHLHHLWRTVGNPPGRAIRFRAAALTVGVIVLPLIAFLLQTATISGFTLPTTAGGWIAASGILILLAWVFRHASSPTTKPPQRVEPRLVRTAAGRRRLASSLRSALKLALPVGLGLGVAFGLAVGLAIGVPVGLTAGITIGLVFGLSGGLTAPQQTAIQPSDPMRQALAWDVLRGVAAWFAGGAIGWLTGYISVQFTGWAAVGLTSWWAGWLSIGLAFGIAVGLIGSPAPLYALTTRQLRRRGALPARPARFLDWAYAAGLLRMSGAATQFRHRNLQIRLTGPERTTEPAKKTVD
ncbi:NACHT domain-containing protein [Amycolatopsis sp. WGS_07]|uniref:NACHT domain-containing protein n=1 Tax=Amycolatopsis sp. WGS_07 TaxID=3076764 RepID=UPI003872CCB9